MLTIQGGLVNIAQTDQVGILKYGKIAGEGRKGIQIKRKIAERHGKVRC
jgi:hypothetical protein